MLALTRPIWYNAGEIGGIYMGDRTERNRRTAPARNAYIAGTYQAVTFRLRKDGSDGMIKDDISRAAERDGLGVNAWILEAIRERM